MVPSRDYCSMTVLLLQPAGLWTSYTLSQDPLLGYFAVVASCEYPNHLYCIAVSAGVWCAN